MRNFFDEKLAIKNGVIDIEEWQFIKKYNKEIYEGSESHPTLLCEASFIIRTFVLDNYVVGNRIF